MRGSKREGPSAPALRKDPYEIFCVSMDASDQKIKTVYRKLALKNFLVRDVGIDRMFQILYASYFSPSLRQDVGCYVSRCRVCQVSKGAASNAGLYILFPIPSHPWSKISMDFVVVFPRLNAGLPYSMPA